MAEQLAGVPAAQSAPVPVATGIEGRGAPAPPGRVHGGAVTASHECEPAIGEDEAPLRGGGAGGEPEVLQRPRDLGEPRGGDAEQPLQVRWCDPGPVADQVEGALLGGLEQGGEQVVGQVPARRSRVDAGGRGNPREGALRGERSLGRHRFQRGPQAEGGGDGGEPPDRVVGTGVNRLPLKGEDGGCRKALQ